MIIDCDACVMRDTDACNDCVVTAILEPERGPLIFDGDEVVAISLFQDAGMLPSTRFEAEAEASEVLGSAGVAASEWRTGGCREDRERAAAGGLHR